MDKLLNSLLNGSNDYQKELSHLIHQIIFVFKTGIL